MKEIKDIVLAARVAASEDNAMALATVVRVEGSSYRRPGARMLVTEDGQMTGAISGGCLEGDALKKALLAIHQRKNRLVSYDTNTEEGSAIGLQLGCNGIVHIFFEYIDLQRADHPIIWLESLLQQRQEVLLITQFSIDRQGEQDGTRLLVIDFTDEMPPEDKQLLELTEHIRLAKTKRQSVLASFEEAGNNKEVLIEYLTPTIRLVVAGAGNDAQPVVETAKLLGWEITVLDGRPSHATTGRFPKADRVIIGPADEVIKKIGIDPWTVFVLMTHNYRYDLTLLKELIYTPTSYIGSLGPKTKLLRMFDDLKKLGVEFTVAQQKIIYGPIGLDIGAETSDEIAIAIIAEIKAVLNGRPAGPLKFLKTKIHAVNPLIH
ncbi:XdhC family protein [Sphingobacterium sp. BIGb0165]|uniref:XdhC family protein n=1 Tax=Sphingobacterium sp. BIGb0165 TaxID=2940615 RepID=UPI00216925F2|nr:XdhC/CoxI family protein [Sphingobacterium sp. BIGb0165]MCS4226282.1 xanthine/CO dehydrogenase XdhC/CoxF family maturation factor [Sphingobacterium sp. BIGb0165]